MSTVKVDSATAKELVSKATANVLRAKTEEVARHIEGELERRNKGFIYRFFGCKPWTEETLRGAYSHREYHFDNPIWVIEHSYEEIEKLILRVGRAVSVGEVSLGIEDASRLHFWSTRYS